MAAKALKITVVGMMIIGMMVLCCSKKNGTGPDNSETIGSIHVILTPEQLRLPSPEAIDSALITILVLDSKGVGLPDIKVNLTRNPEIGHITQPDSTDSQGQTSAWFVADPGVYDTTRISVTAGDVTTSALLTISELSSEIARIVVSPDSGFVVADGMDTISIRATAYDSAGAFVRDGTIIYFSNTGRGLLSSSHLTTINGQVRNRILSPRNIPLSPSVDSIFVRSSLNDSDPVADTSIIRYISGPVGLLNFIYPESPLYFFSNSGDTCSMIVSASDINGNPVADGTQIYFKNNGILMGTLHPAVAATIDGIAVSIYTAGESLGADRVLAWVPNPQDVADTIFTARPIVINYGPPPDSTLVLYASNPEIQVGGDSTQIIAFLQDAYGNPLREGYYVAFDITVAPIDSAGRRPSFDSQFQVQHDTVQTNINGRAIIQLYSGIKAGAVSIRACTVPLPPDSLYICDERPLVTILPGPPGYIDITFSYVGEAVNPNTPERYVQVGAVVGDRYANPVQYGTAIYFSLLPSYIGDIERDSYTGGARPYHPDSANGVAYTRIIYGCFRTFDWVQVIATSAGDSSEIIDTSLAYPLPIYQGEISIHFLRDSLWTPDSTCNSSDTSDIMITLTDGGGCPIDNGIIYYSALDAGQIIGQTIDTTDVNGHSCTRFMIRGCDIPRQPDGRARIEAHIRATLAQNQTVLAVEPIICTRP